MAWCVVYGRKYCSSSVILMDYYSLLSLLLFCLSPLLVCHLYLHRLLLLLPSVYGSFLGLLLDLFFLLLWSTLQRSHWNTQRALAVSIFVDILTLSCLSVHSSLVKSVLPIVIASFFRKFVSWGQSYS